MTETATIRVPRQTRDLLAEQARVQGVSLSSLLTHLAHQVRREAIFRSEREATRRDAATPAVKAEEDDWAAVLADGID